MSLQEIGLDTTMEDILRAYPSAKIGLFQRYHVGGCASCGYQPTDTLAEVCRTHNIVDSVDAVICTYCMPLAEYDWLEKSAILSFEEITRLQFCGERNSLPTGDDKTGGAR